MWMKKMSMEYFVSMSTHASPERNRKLFSRQDDLKSKIKRYLENSTIN